ncbi:MAG: hypothetical protein JWR26_1377 [Pedosphaera sp.]|nr:hypothetical protein [Pedosphaera sp.]
MGGVLAIGRRPFLLEHFCQCSSWRGSVSTVKAQAKNGLIEMVKHKQRRFCVLLLTRLGSRVFILLIQWSCANERPFSNAKRRVPHAGLLSDGGLHVIAFNPRRSFTFYDMLAAHKAVNPAGESPVVGGELLK